MHICLRHATETGIQDEEREILNLKRKHPQANETQNAQL